MVSQQHRIFTVFSMVMFMYLNFSGPDTEDIDIEHWLIQETNLKLKKPMFSLFFLWLVFWFNGIIHVKQNI